ncbi:MAG: hypothetical protein ACK4YP_09510 [Myxococcota bacterium]
MIALLLAGVATAAPLVLYDLEAGDGGFTATGDAGQWEWGTVLNGPGGGFDGPRGWSTGRVSNYLNASADYLEVPVPSLDGVARASFSFQHWYDIIPGDYAWVEVDSGNGWTAIEPLYGYPVGAGYSGASGGWRPAVYDLSTYQPPLRVRLVFQTDLSGVSSGWTVDQVAFHDGDVAAPKLWDVTVLEDTDDLEGPYTVEVQAVDDTAVTGVDLVWRAHGAEGVVAMEPVGGDTWRGVLPAQPPDTEVTYRVEGTDGLNAAREPFDDDLSFRVYLPAPTDLVGPAGRVVDTEATLSWAAPEGRNEVLGYEVVRGGLVVARSDATEAVVPLAGGGDAFAVRAVYAAGAGDLSDHYYVDSVVPTVSALAPAEGWPGDTLRVALTGSYLLLVDGEVSANLGAGVAVTGIEVRDVDRAWLSLAVSDDAGAGPRALVLQNGDDVLTVPDAFTVLDGEDRPRLLRATPDVVRQGDEGELVLDLVGDLEGDPVVDLGDGIVTGAVRYAGDSLVVPYTVTGTAPLGERAVTLDDGVRVFRGVTLEVKNTLPTTQRGCGTPVTPTGVLVVGGLVLAALRRRG